MMRTAWVLSIVGGVFFLVHSCRASNDGFVQPSMASRDVIACSSTTQPHELTGDSGWFTSANYPESYPNSTTCRWLITSTKKTVTLDFIDFFTEVFDKVRIYSGNTTSSFLLMEVYGQLSSPPKGIRSRVQQMLVVFTSDSIVSYRGFNATYSSSDIAYEPGACDPITRPLEMTEPEGTFQSEGFPVAYDSNSLCQWLFVSQVPDGIVRVQFQQFHTQAGFDYVKIYDGSSSSAKLLGTLQGIAPVMSPKLYYSSTEYLFVQFVSDSTDNRPGFNGTYMSLAKPTTTAFPPGRCGTNLRVSPSEATILPTHDIMCQLDRLETKFLETNCFDLIQNLPGIGNADELVQQGGNFGCYLTNKETHDDAPLSCYDNYQWLSQLGKCEDCTRTYVCIRF